MSEIEIQAAQQRRQQQEGALYRDDGSKIFADAEHRDRLRAIEREFSAEMDKIEDGISSKLAEAQEALLVAETPDASTTLSTGEIERAAALRQFLAEETQGMPNAALIERTRVAIAAKDRPTMYLLHHLATQRFNQNPDSDLAGELRDVAHQLRTSLDPQAESRLEAAKADLAGAEDLQFKAQLARVGANSLGDAYFGGGQGQGPSSYWGVAS